jgi:hypothetical protein
VRLKLSHGGAHVQEEGEGGTSKTHVEARNLRIKELKVETGKTNTRVSFSVLYIIVTFSVFLYHRSLGSETDAATGRERASTRERERERERGRERKRRKKKR